METAAKSEGKDEDARAAKPAKGEDDAPGNNGSSCSILRMAYNECFNRLYTENFLKGQWEKEECMLECQAYRACLSKRWEDRSLRHLLRLENLMLATNRKRGSKD